MRILSTNLFPVAIAALLGIVLGPTNSYTEQSSPTVTFFSDNKFHLRAKFDHFHKASDEPRERYEVIDLMGPNRRPSDFELRFQQYSPEILANGNTLIEYRLKLLLCNLRRDGCYPGELAIRPRSNACNENRVTYEFQIAEHGEISSGSLTIPALCDPNKLLSLVEPKKEAIAELPIILGGMKEIIVANQSTFPVRLFRTNVVSGPNLDISLNDDFVRGSRIGTEEKEPIGAIYVSRSLRSYQRALLAMITREQEEVLLQPTFAFVGETQSTAMFSEPIRFRVAVVPGPFDVAIILLAGTAFGFGLGLLMAMLVRGTQSQLFARFLAAFLFTILMVILLGSVLRMFDAKSVVGLFIFASVTGSLIGFADKKRLKQWTEQGTAWLVSFLQSRVKPG